MLALLSYCRTCTTVGAHLLPGPPVQAPVLAFPSMLLVAKQLRQKSLQQTANKSSPYIERGEYKGSAVRVIISKTKTWSVTHPTCWIRERCQPKNVSTHISTLKHLNRSTFREAHAEKHRHGFSTLAHISSTANYNIGCLCWSWQSSYVVLNKTNNCASLELPVSVPWAFA